MCYVMDKVFVHIIDAMLQLGRKNSRGPTIVYILGVHNVHMPYMWAFCDCSFESDTY